MSVGRAVPISARALLLVLAAIGATIVLVAPIDLSVADRPGTATAIADGFVPLGEASGAGLAAAAPAPELVGAGEPPLLDLDGREVRLLDFRGRPVWIVFWATWCPPCREEMPALSAAAEAYADQGLTMLAINVEEPPAVAEAYVTELGLDMTVLSDPRGRSMRQWGVFGLPTHYLVGPDGTIAWRSFGPLSSAEIERRAADATRVITPGDG